MIPALLLACAANVAPVTLEAVIRVESRGNPLALHVNGVQVQPPPAMNVAEAIGVAKSYIRRGFSVDVGLMQINSRNLAALGMTVEHALDPCANIRGGAEILTADYAEAARRQGEGQSALRGALSAYNTGDFSRGFRNGYVARYYGPGGVPALVGGVREVAVGANSQASHAPTPPNPYTASTSVFAREARDVKID
jgi:type IV secretion system protein VirB1